MKSVWLALLLSGPLWAQSLPRVAARFTTAPARVEVYQETSDRQPRYLGDTSQTLWLDGRVGRLSLIFRAPGYHEERLQLAPGYFYSHPSWPEQGALRLRPERVWPGWLASGMLFILAALLWKRSRRPRLGDYRLLNTVGQGGGSRVYRALRDGDTVPVALKLLEPGATLAEEVSRLSRLQHPNIVALVDYGHHRGRDYLVSEYVGGGSLRHRSPWSRPEIRAWLEQLGQALSYAHRQGVVHGDLKLEHLLLDSAGALKVIDFGLHAEQLGTPGYLAPEQALRQPVSPATDQYGMGMVAYELMTGERPHGGGLHGLWQVPDQHPQLGPDLLAVLRRMLERDPAARYPELSLASEELCRHC